MQNGDRVTKTISIPLDNNDLVDSEVAGALHDMAVLCNALVSNITRAAGQEKPLAGGAGHPIVQAIYTAAAQLEQAAAMMAGPRRIAPAQAVPKPGLVKQ